MTAQDVCNWVSSEEGKTAVEVLKYVGLGSGWVIMTLVWVYGRLFGHKADVARIITGLKEAESQTIEMEGEGHTPVTPKYVKIRVLTIPDTGHNVLDSINVHVGGDPKDPLNTRPAQGVVYLGKTDQSYLYAADELRTILKAAQDRDREILAEIANKARHCLANRIKPKQKKA